jgi:hypothetical protein
MLHLPNVAELVGDEVIRYLRAAEEDDAVQCVAVEAA